jgi:hypothetical protein
MDELVANVNRYATVEAEAREREGARATALDIALRPVLRFAWCYVWKGGWRLGVRGLNWSLLRAAAEWLRWAKLWERQNVGDSSQPPDELVNRPRTPRR